MSGFGTNKGHQSEQRQSFCGTTPSSSANVVSEQDRRGLRLDTDIASSPQFQAVSMVPTPLMTSTPSMDFNHVADSQPHSSGRIVSASLVPDSVSSLQSPSSGRMHQNLLWSADATPPNQDTIVNERRRGSQVLSPTPVSPTTIVSTPAAAAAVSRGNSLLIPKRGDRPQVSLSRSASVGGPQRQPSTILHRERKATAPLGADLPEEVYVASTESGAQTAWTRIKPVGKGSFSEVVLSCPALEFVKPEYYEEVADLTNREVSQLKDASANDAEPPKLLVAVKITRLGHGKAEAQLESFKRDVDIMSNLPHHPSLMKLIGSSIDMELHKRAIFVLPYCPGGDLFDLVASHRSKLSSLLIRRLFADICSAVVFLHDNFIVHRDIKLENVLLGAQASTLLRMERPDAYDKPIAVVTDLGLARKIDPQEPMLTTRCGSDDYVPPEIMLGQAYDGRETDSWALGVLLYAMLEGRLPFDAPPELAQHDSSRARLRTAHRIARVDWSWYKRREETSPEWLGGKEIVAACLTRRSHRTLAKGVLKSSWVSEALPATINDTRNADDIWRIFVQ